MTGNEKGLASFPLLTSRSNTQELQLASVTTIWLAALNANWDDGTWQLLTDC